MGREPVEHHEHYDVDGVLTGWTLVRKEPEYTSLDRARMLASRRKEADVGPHGIPMSEATDPANEHAFQGQKKPRVDFAEKQRRDDMERYYKRWPDANRNGHLWGVTRKSER